MSPDRSTVETVSVLGRKIASGRFSAIGAAILGHARSAKPAYICVSGAHPLSLARADPGFAAALDGAALITPDGMPVRWMLALKGYRHSERVAGPDLAPWLITEAEGEGLPVYFYGGFPDQLDALRRALALSHPTLKVVGWDSPPALPVRPDFDAETVARMNASGARLIFIGLGCPRQEFWMATHSAAVNGTMVGIGAAFSFMSGRLTRAPRILQALGLEWLYRLAQEPRRLLGRYLFHNARFVWFALLDLAAHRRKRGTR